MAGALAQAMETGVVAPLEDGSGGRKWWRGSLFWKLRAKVRRQISKMTTTSSGRSGRRGRGSRSAPGRFHYDPFSYALNFDDGIATLLPTLLIIVCTAKAGNACGSCSGGTRGGDSSCLPDVGGEY